MRETIEKYFQKALDCLEDSRLLIENTRFDGAINRAYYAYFDAIRTLLLIHDYTSKTHNGIHSKFRELYIKTGVFEQKYSELLGEITQLRQGSDYEAWIELEHEDATFAYEAAKDFLEEVKKYLIQNNYL